MWCVLGADGEGLGEAVGSAELLDGALAVVGGIGPGAGGIDGQGAEGSGEGLGDEPVLAGIGVDDGEIAGIGKGAHAGDGDVLGDRAGGIASDDGHVGHGGDGAIDSTGIGGIAVGDDIVEADGAVIVGVRVKVMTPMASMATVPLGTMRVWALPVRVTPLIDSMERTSPSRSVSLASRSSVTDPSSATVNGSSVATGASLTAVTVPLTYRYRWHCRR